MTPLLIDLIYMMIAILSGCIIGRLAEYYEWKGSFGIACSITGWVLYFFWRL